MTQKVKKLQKIAQSPAVKANELMQWEILKKELSLKIADRKAELLGIMQDQDILSLKTGKYTLTRAHKITPQVIDFDALKNALDREEIPYETKEVFDERMNPVFKTIIEEGKVLMGLQGLETEYISIRIK